MTKTNINEQIKSARKQKGMTQQELAEEAGISLRTVQRIEKGIEEISGFSLRQISKVLDIPLEQIIMQNVNQISIDSNQIGSIKTLYLSSLAFLFNPVFGLIVPAIIGFSKQNKNLLFKKHLKKVLLIHFLGLLSIGLLIAYIYVSKIFHIKLIEPLYSMFNSLWFLLMPIIYYLIIIGLILFNIYKLNKINNDNEHLKT